MNKIKVEIQPEERTTRFPEPPFLAQNLCDMSLVLVTGCHSVTQGVRYRCYRIDGSTNPDNPQARQHYLYLNEMRVFRPGTRVILTQGDPV